MKKMQAIVQVTVRIPLDTEVEDLELVPVKFLDRRFQRLEDGEEADSHTTYEATNERKALASRKTAARDAVNVAKETFSDFDVVDLVVNEVSEVES
jgi:hypothetical protein